MPADKPAEPSEIESDDIAQLPTLISANPAQGPASDAAAVSRSPTRRMRRGTARAEPSRVASESLPSIVEAGSAQIEGDAFNDRYEFRRLLGEGGMGEVRLCRDRRVGREVALKVMREGGRENTESRRRFVREARVQGQLEHPSVVPVYDLGVSPDGEAFFTMQRVRGMTLEEVLDALAESDPIVGARYSRRRLLTAFSSVCLAVEFAHSRGVLHRDLKPANVMLGEFGEVHVLDWGLAKIRGTADAPDAVAVSGDLGPVGRGQTVEGSMLGTPGYMAPEQVRGENEALDARADVYALGAMLFEVLTLEPLHLGRTMQRILGSTIEGADARASRRVPDADVPPELEAVCVRATALDPAERFPTVRALADAVERYLDGDRDLVLRKEMAAAHAEVAKRSWEKSQSGDAAAETARTEALRESMRALALDPDHAGAVGTMARVLMDDAGDAPPGAEAELREAAANARRTTGRMIALRYATWVVFTPILAWMGVRDWRICGVTLGLTIAAALFGLWVWRTGRTGSGHVLALVGLSSAGIAMLSMFFGPFIVAPSMAATNSMMYALHSEKRVRRVISAVSVLSLVGPWLLQTLGLLPPVYAFRDGMMCVVPTAVSLPPVPTTAFLLLTATFLALTPNVLVGRVRDALALAERRLLIRSWRLRQLVPAEAQETMRDPQGK